MQSDAFNRPKEAFVASAKMKRLSTDGLAKLRIPVPPVEVQHEIVRVLDLFSALEADLAMQLDAELEARRLQYAHYRKTLCHFLRWHMFAWRRGEIIAWVSSEFDSTTTASRLHLLRGDDIGHGFERRRFSWTRHLVCTQATDRPGIRGWRGSVPENCWHQWASVRSHCFPCCREQVSADDATSTVATWRLILAASTTATCSTGLRRTTRS